MKKLKYPMRCPRCGGEFIILQHNKCPWCDLCLEVDIKWDISSDEDDEEESE
jgi:ribosomal protein S27AE